MILYQLNHNMIITYYQTEKVTIKIVMQIHNIMVLIFITCAVTNHLFFTLWSMSVMHFFFNDSSTFEFKYWRNKVTNMIRKAK